MFRLTGAALTLLIVASVVGASAFTTGYIDRSSTITITSDTSTAEIGLTDGTSGDFITATNGKNQISFAPNGNAVFTLGDAASVTTKYAIQITNNDKVSHKMKLEYKGVTDPDGTNTNLEFKPYQSASTAVTTDGTTALVANETNGVQTSSESLAAGSSWYVVVVVDTTGLDTTNANALDGTLRVTLA